MGHAYTPGLLVTERRVITKRRILPLKGEVLVKKGDRVEADTVVARTNLPGAVEPLNVANLLGVPPEDVDMCMLKKTGEPVQAGEVTLRGYVSRREVKRLAEDIADSVFGVKDVSNQIKVKQRTEWEEEKPENEPSGKQRRAS